MELKSYYGQKKAALEIAIQNLRAKSKWFITAEVGSFVLMLVMFYFYFFGDGSWFWLLLAVVLLLVYANVRKRDSDNDRNISRNSALFDVYQNELKSLSGDYSAFDDGSRYLDPKHEYTYDLDVFGRDSLYNRICRAVTTAGRDQLAADLSTLNYNGNHREAIDSLSSQEEFLASFKAEGNRETVDSDKVKQAMQSVSSLHLPLFYASPLSLILGWIDIVCFLVSIALGIAGVISSSVPLWWGAFNFFGVLLLCQKSIHAVDNVVGKLREQLMAYIRMISKIRNVSSDSKEIVRIKSSLEGSDASFRKLTDILQSLESRDNLAGLILFNIFGLSDLFLLRRFVKWQRQYVDKIESWIQSVTEIDVLVSMATMKFNHPEARDAEVVESSKIVYEAKGLYHPFLGMKAKKNDFTIADHNYYIVTGANMAGKSTFLRALGVNYILAMNGMPVFADSFKVSMFRLFSSMRTSDDLTHGISYFNAELLRLKQLLHYVDEAGRPTLIILDEILKGTNSVDKLNGSRMFLESISKKNVAGVIATHDLELSKMAEEQPEVFHNYCFEIKVGEHVTYDYKITPGVARNQNATYLLKQILEGLN